MSEESVKLVNIIKETIKRLASNDSGGHTSDVISSASEFYEEKIGGLISQSKDNLLIHDSEKGGIFWVQRRDKKGSDKGELISSNVSPSLICKISHLFVFSPVLVPQ